MNCSFLLLIVRNEFRSITYNYFKAISHQHLNKSSCPVHLHKLFNLLRSFSPNKQHLIAIHSINYLIYEFKCTRAGATRYSLFYARAFFLQQIKSTECELLNYTFPLVSFLPFHFISSTMFLMKRNMKTCESLSFPCFCPKDTQQDKGRQKRAEN